jgi:hypothetical protein
MSSYMNSITGANQEEIGKLALARRRGRYSYQHALRNRAGPRG